MFTVLLDALFPRSSLLGTHGEWITAEERRQLHASIPVHDPRDVLRASGVAFLDSLVAAGTYDHAPLLRKAVHTFKYRRIPALHQALASLMTDAMHGHSPIPQGDVPVLCAVPLHWTREFQRGFNQAALLSSAISHTTGWHTVSLLRRVRPTGSQALRTRTERLTALLNAFSVRNGCSVPRCILLVDDIATTGSTLDQCAKPLKEAGAKWVGALVIARGGDHSSNA